MSDGIEYITTHFARSEFAQPARHGCPHIPYPTRLLPVLHKLCAQLELIRSHTGGQLHISSGYRSPEYNRIIGGARHSQHLLGTAADIVCTTCDSLELGARILGLYKVGELQIGGLGFYPSFIHVDVRPGKLVRWRGGRNGN